MPEGPEVKLMVNDTNMISNILKNIIFTKYSKFKKSMKNYKNLSFPEKILKNYTIGKEIFIELKNYIIILNLGFGRLNNFETKYCVIKFILNNKTVYLNDMRKFSSIDIIKRKDLKKYQEKLGYDPLYHKNIGFKDFYEKYVLKVNSRQKIYKKLLDQRIFAGCGNYIRCELIYDSKVNPFCIYNKMSKKNWKRIFKSYKKIYISSYNSQIKPFYYGNFTFKVYRRIDKKEVKRIKNNNRSFWYSINIKYYNC